MGIPSHWMNYVASENVDQSAAKIKALGGSIVSEPMDVFDSGRMAVAKDPQGASFGLWQAKNHHGAGVIDEPNAVCWNELATNDTRAATTFYAGVFGWTTEAFGGDYTLFKHPAKTAGGMMAIQKEWGPMPPNWGVYFAVEDCDKMVAKASGLGAKVVMPAKAVPTVGRFALLSDPSGGMFYILQPA
jgi:predicted enzyme related to lactoylglutathione lyase